MELGAFIEQSREATTPGELFDLLVRAADSEAIRTIFNQSGLAWNVEHPLRKEFRELVQHARGEN